jgi:amidase
LVYWDHTLDHVGPISAGVQENAAILEVIAGGDWRDPQWVRADPIAGRYLDGLDAGIRGLRIGVITDSLCECTVLTRAAFDTATACLKQSGAEVVQVTVPLWSHALTVWTGVLTYATIAMSESLGQGYSHLGRIHPDLLVAAAEQSRSERRPPSTTALAYEHIRQSALGLPFAHTQNLRLELRRQVDSLFAGVDLLVTPTAVAGPIRLPDTTSFDRDTERQLLKRLTTNTVALNLTGHPALTVPFGTVEHGLPAGVQIIGRRFDEQTVYRAGFAVEAASAKWG